MEQIWSLASANYVGYLDEEYQKFHRENSRAEFMKKLLRVVICLLHQIQSIRLLQALWEPVRVGRVELEGLRQWSQVVSV